MANGANESQSRQNAESLGVIQQRLTTLESQVSQVLRGFSDFQTTVAARFDEWTKRGATNWTAVLSMVFAAVTVVVGVITIIGSLAKAPIDTELNRDARDLIELRANIVPRAENEREWNRIYTAIDKLTQISGTFLTKEEAQIRANAANASRDDRYRQTDVHFSRIDLELEKLRDQIVPRGENAEHWRGTEARELDLQRQVDEVKRFQQNLVPAADYLKMLDERLRLLETRKQTAP